MSDYDSIFSNVASGKPAESPYDDVFKAIAPKVAEPTADAPAVVKAGAVVNNTLAEIPRQLGLTARYGLEGLANAAQIVTEPLRYLTDKLTPDRAPTLSQLVTGERTPKSTPLGVQASKLADYIGLPSPQGPTERVVGDAARLMAGTGGMGGVASAARNAPGMVGAAANLLSSNMGSQVSSAAGAGLAGGSVREAGGSPLMQGVASLSGGVLGGLVPGAASATLDAGRSVVRNLTGRAPTVQDMDVRIGAVLERAGVDYSQVPERVRQSLRQDLAGALNTGGDLDPAAVRRLVDFRTTGLTPTRGAITQDPVQITREMNLAKTGANTANDELQGLARVQNQNNARIIGGLNAVGAGTNTDPVVAGRTLTNNVLGTQATLRGAERQAWQEARNSPAYTQPIFPDALNAINRALGDEGMMGFMNPTISRYMEAFQTGQQPFTPQAYRNLQSMLSNELAKGGNEAMAARIARDALERTPIQPITNPRGIDLGNMPVTGQQAAALRAADAQPGQAVDAINRARAATRAAYGYEDSSTLVRSILSDGASADPTRVAQRFVLNGTPDEATVVAREAGPAGRAVIRDALATYIKREAIGGAADEVGKVSQSQLNSVLRKIGDEKLRLFFTPDEISQLHALGRVASYVQVQPVGSAVNNSNSGTFMLGKGIDALASVANSTPFVGPWVTQPLTNGVRNLNVAIQTRNAQNVTPGLLAPVERPPIGSGLLLPGIAAGGLLAAP